MGTVWQDLRYALRGIIRAPFLSLAVLLALVAGVGLNAAVFTLIDSVWLRAPVETESASFIQAIPSYSGWFATENQFHGFTVRDYEAIRRRAKSLQKVAGFSGAGSVKLDSAEVGLGLVTCNFFDVYGWDLVLGRLFRPEECLTPGATPVVVVSETLWRNRYEADPRIAGKTIHIKRQPYTVVGVVSFRSPPWMRGDLWVPYTMQPLLYDGYDGFKEHPDYPWLSVVGRLNSGYSQSDAQAELRTIQSQQDSLVPGRKTTLQVTNGSLFQDPQNRALGFVILPLIMGPMALVLLVACTNVTMLLLSRAAARRSEIDNSAYSWSGPQSIAAHARSGRHDGRTRGGYHQRVSCIQASGSILGFPSKEKWPLPPRARLDGVRLPCWRDITCRLHRWACSRSRIVESRFATESEGTAGNGNSAHAHTQHSDHLANGNELCVGGGRRTFRTFAAFDYFRESRL
jgi:hypothetical protein